MQNKTIPGRIISLTLAGLVTIAAIGTGCGSQEPADSADTADTTAAQEDTMATDTTTESSTAATEIDETQTEAEVASENTKPIEITTNKEYDSRYIDEYHVYVDAFYPSFSCEEENYGMLNDGLKDLSQTIAANAKEEIDKVEEYARADAENGILEEYSSYAYEQSAQLIRADSSVVSLLVTTYVNQGGAHPSTSYTTYNYDPQAGMAFELDEIIQDEQYDQLASIIAESLANTYDHSLFNCYMDLASASADGEVDHDAFQDALTADVQTIIDDGTLAYTIGQTGITFYFEAYALAVYAAGSQVVTINYADAPDLVWEGYTHAPARYITTVTSGGTYVENADGELVSVVVDLTSQGEMSYAYNLSIRLDGEEYTEEIPAYDAATFLVHVDGRNYLYVDAIQESDWETLYVYDLNGGTPTAVGSLERWFENDTPSNPDHMVLQSILQLLSTCGIERTYHVGDDGMPAADMDYDLIYWTAAESLTTLQDITAPVRDTFEGTGTEETLPAGTTLTPYASDGENWVDLETGDGRYVRLEITSNWPQTYHGTDIQELFDGLVFAG